MSGLWRRRFPQVAVIIALAIATVGGNADGHGSSGGQGLAAASRTPKAWIASSPLPGGGSPGSPTAASGARKACKKPWYRKKHRKKCAKFT